MLRPVAPGGSCTVTIEPGAVASLDSGANPCTLGSEPVEGGVTVTANNAQLQVGVLVLGYGCIYQGGYIFSIDDTQGCNTTPCTGNIGGKVTAPSDAPSAFVWDSSTACISTANCFVTNADSGFDGLDDTNIIYNVLTTQNGLVANTYGAGFCHDAVISNHADWYLPAICEMGYGANPGFFNCGTINSPTLQNIQSNLAVNGVGGFLYDVYLSSTEEQVNPTNSMWSQSLGLFPTQSTDSKFVLRNVRCVRAF